MYSNYYVKGETEDLEASRRRARRRVKRYNKAISRIRRVTESENEEEEGGENTNGEGGDADRITLPPVTVPRTQPAAANLPRRTSGGFKETSTTAPSTARGASSGQLRNSVRAKRDSALSARLYPAHDEEEARQMAEYRVWLRREQKKLREEAEYERIIGMQESSVEAMYLSRVLAAGEPPAGSKTNTQPLTACDEERVMRLVRMKHSDLPSSILI
eukprot:Rmarinus@m.10532